MKIFWGFGGGGSLDLGVLGWVNVCFGRLFYPFGGTSCRVELILSIPWRWEEQLLPKRYIFFKLQGVLPSKIAVSKRDNVLLFLSVTCELRISSCTIRIYCVIQFCFHCNTFSVLMGQHQALYKNIMKIYHWGKWMRLCVLTFPEILPFHKYF
jgi:hypothetical protein